MMAAGLRTATAAAPRTVVPPLMAALARPPGPRAPRRRPTTASAMAPKPLRTARPAATPGAPKHQPTAPRLPRRELAAGTAGVTRPARAAGRMPTMRPPPVPAWARLPRPHSMLPHRAPTRHQHRPPPALRRRVHGRVAGALMPRPLRPWGLPPQPLVAGITAHRRRPRTAVRRRRLLRRARFGTPMTIEGKGGKYGD